jgi:hypothetical protein
VTSCIRMLRLGVIVRAETMMLVTSATGSGRMALAVDRYGIVSREDKSVGPPASRYARREALAGRAAERPALGLATPDYQLAVLPENASRNRARSPALTSETAQNVKPPALQDSML